MANSYAILRVANRDAPALECAFRSRYHLHPWEAYELPFPLWARYALPILGEFEALRRLQRQRTTAPGQHASTVVRRAQPAPDDPAEHRRRLRRLSGYRE